MRCLAFVLDGMEYVMPTRFLCHTCSAYSDRCSRSIPGPTKAMRMANHQSYLAALTVCPAILKANMPKRNSIHAARATHKRQPVTLIKKENPHSSSSTACSFSAQHRPPTNVIISLLASRNHLTQTPARPCSTVCASAPCPETLGHRQTGHACRVLEAETARRWCPKALLRGRDWGR